MTINWKSYWKDEQVNDYNLTNYKDDKIEVKLFNTNDLTMKGNYQINYLNPYLGELPMMYYIWKNNLKSDYIKISQYRRDITYIDYDELDKNNIQVICLWDENKGVKLKDRILGKRDPSNKIKNVLWKFIKEYYHLSNKELSDIQNKTSYRCMACFVWAMNWKRYCELCELIFGFLNSLFPNEGWKNIDTILKFRDNEKIVYKEKYGVNDDWVYDDNRYLTFIVEDVLSVLLYSFMPFFANRKFQEDTFIISNVDKNNTIFNIAKFYKLNLKCNPHQIFIRCLDDESYNSFHKFFMDENNWEFNAIYILSKDEKCEENTITLNINQYIDLDLPSHLQEKKYSIKQII